MCVAVVEDRQRRTSGSRRIGGIDLGKTIIETCRLRFAIDGNRQANYFFGAGLGDD